MLNAPLTPLIALSLIGPAAATAHAQAADPRPVAATAASAATLTGLPALSGLPAPSGLSDLAEAPGLPDLPGLDALDDLRVADLFPPVIALPDGFAPEGVALGYGPLLYAGSLQDGAIWRGDVVTGRGEVFVPGEEGRVAAGMTVDQRGRLWVAGASTGQARVYDGLTGEELASYELVPEGGGFINDVVVTPDAAYFTDSQAGSLQVVAIGPGGRLAGQGRALPLSGDLEVVEDGFNLNGIETAPDGEHLLAVQSATGLLFRVDPAAGTTVRVGGLQDGALSDGDGLLREGSTLYVVRNRLDQIAVLDLDAAGSSAAITGMLTDDDLDVPTTIGLFGPFLYAVNARFGTEVTPTTEYDAVRVTRS